ncbi:MAG: putative transporter [Terrimicrobiaceae bacterium]
MWFLSGAWPHDLLKAQIVMNWLENYASANPVAYSILLISLVAVVGLGFATLKVRGIGVGVTGVLFAGLIFGHFGFHLEHHTLEFLREFGLILFVFTIGLQIGPGFFASLRDKGLALNGLAAGIVIGGGILTAIFAKFFGIPFGAAAGLFAGATTNTPSLGAAQQTLLGMKVDEAISGLPALSYAVAYPLGIVGIIVSMILIRVLFRIDVSSEAAQFEESQRSGGQPIERANLRVDNPNLDGLRVDEIPGLHETEVTVSRLKRRGEADVRVATGASLVHTGDTLLAVGTAPHLESFQRIVGARSDEDLMKAPGDVTFKRVIVTNKPVLGRTVRQLGFEAKYGVSVTRLQRGGVEMMATSDVQLQFGDVLVIVGDAATLEQVAAELGNSPKQLNETNFIPVFFGIVLGIIAGSLPIALPGLPVAVRLGLAGGPLVIAILLARVGNIGQLVWYMPGNVNYAFRELGIILFLACVGLKAGSQFVSTLLSPSGLLWLVCGAMITIVPVLAAGLFGRAILKLNYMTILGLQAGSMTDPPALAFANTIVGSHAPAISYASVYPLTMLLRITVAQVLVILLAG